MLDGLAARLSMSPGTQPIHVTPAGHGLEENGLLRTWYPLGVNSEVQRVPHTHIGIMPVIKDQITALRRHNA